MKRLAIASGVLVVALVGSVLVRVAVAEDEKELVVVHWSNSHLTRDGLLPDMAEEFNADHHETKSGERIKVVVVPCDSAVQAEDLVARVKGAGQAEKACKTEDGERAGDPTIVTPQSRDWLVGVNHEAGQKVVDLDAATDIARTWLGIVTYQKMAECLGWPGQIGYEELLALLREPKGWGAHPECEPPADWGREPLLAFTNPSTSTSGRNVLVSLYAMAAGKTLDQLTVEDIDSTKVVDSVREFQGLVDHYQPGTIPLNTKISQGPRFGQFFLMPEDNLVSLYRGKEKAIAADGTVQPVKAVKDLVMIYPKEGSVLNGHAAGVVTAPWVSADDGDAARQWIDYLHEDDQQRTFMAAGFRPPTDSKLKVNEAAFRSWGLDAKEPANRIAPSDLQPDVLKKIIDSWSAVKNPAIVTFVVDTSGSMGEDGKLESVKEGLRGVVDALSGADVGGSSNKVGLVTFSDNVTVPIEPTPIQEAKLDVVDAVDRMTAAGSTSLYEAVQRGIEVTDAAPGDERASRAVVVLSDGEASPNTRCLNDIVTMVRDEDAVSFCGRTDDKAVDANGAAVTLSKVRGVKLRLGTTHNVQVFFVGFGDADVDTGRILAQATGAEYQGSTKEDLASVIAELSGYF